MVNMATLEETSMAMQMGRQGVDPGDKDLMVTFASCEHADDAASREAGRPIFAMVDYITIQVPGDKDSTVHRPVRPGDAERFPIQWSRYKNSQEQVVGTPLSSWPQISKAQVAELAYFNVKTIEQLASISDANAQKFMGINTLRSQAQAYLKLLAEQDPLFKLQAELQSRDETIATQAKQIADLQAAVDEIRKGSGKK